MAHTDIQTGGFIEKFLPPAARPYAVLMRLDRPVGIWLLLLPALWAIALGMGGAARMTAGDLKLMVLFALGAVIMRAAGCIVNDLWDRRLDGQVERTKGRPLASGAVTPQAAIILLSVLFVFAVKIVTQMSLVTVLLAFLSLPLIILYPLMKRITWWPQLFLGVTFNFGALMGWAAVTYVIGVPALLLYAGGIFWTLAYDTIYAHQDIEDDMRIGIKSTAIRLGAQSKRWVALFMAAALVLIALAFVAADAGILSCLFLLLPAAHAVWRLRLWTPEDPGSSLTAFRASRDFGLLVLLAALI